MSNHPSRSSTPVQRVGTPIQRVGTPNRGSRQGTPVIFNASDKLVKDPPNNLNMRDPRYEQGVTNSLLGTQGTVPVGDIEQSEEEKNRIQDMADRLNK